MQYNFNTPQEARQHLIKVWSACEFGIKERVKVFHPYRTIHYIMSTETYSKIDTVVEILKRINQVTKEVKKDVTQMADKVIEMTE